MAARRRGEQFGSAALELQQLAGRDRVFAADHVDLDPELDILAAVAQGATGEVVVLALGGESADLGVEVDIFDIADFAAGQVEHTGGFNHLLVQFVVNRDRQFQVHLGSLKPRKAAIVRGAG